MAPSLVGQIWSYQGPPQKKRQILGSFLVSTRMKYYKLSIFIKFLSPRHSPLDLMDRSGGDAFARRALGASDLPHDGTSMPTVSPEEIPAASLCGCGPACMPPKSSAQCAL